jgi:hypothetical protein
MAMEVLSGTFLGCVIGYIISFILQERKYKYDLSMVAISKRLEVHQAAYTLFLDIRNYPSGDPLEIYSRGIHFIRENAIYLYKDAYEAIEVSLNHLEKCSLLNDDPQKLGAELKLLELQGEKIKNSLGLPEIKISKVNRNI